ncbi:MAG: sensor histidine kinase [Chloroflexi bacterium]|nr:sensor histidine kinase [Chloroflexota bacterium]
MRNRRLESGLLTVFRLFTGLRVIFAIIFAVARLAAPDQQVRIFEVLEPALLMFVLSLPALRGRHGHRLLPVALVIAGIGPLVTQAEALLDDRAPRLPIETILTLQTWSSMIVLLLPVVIIAWQYRFQQVVWFSLGITVLNAVIIIVTGDLEALKSALVASSLIFRLITFMVTGWLVVRLMEVQREQRHALKEANRQLIHHAATLEQLTTTRERNRLARELHDTLAHTLSAVAVQLEAVNALWSTKPDQAHARLEKSIQVTRSGLTETRRVLQDLRASPLEDLGLALAVRSLAESTASRSGLELDLHVAERLGSVTPDIEQAVYRITQEALANVVSHANARHLTVQLGRFGSHLVLTVSDDGQGFDPTAHKSAKRFGIQGMCERAEMIGGTLELESSSGQGTIVMLSIEVGT